MSTSRAQTRKSCRTTVADAAFISLICSEPKRKIKAERWNDQALLFSPSLDGFSRRLHHELSLSRTRSNFWLLPNESLLCLRPGFDNQKSLMASQGLFVRARGWFRIVVPPITIFGLLCGLKGKQFWIEIASLGASFLTLCSPHTCKDSKKQQKNPPTFQFRREFVSTGEDMNLQQFDSINMIFSRLQ